MKKTLLLLMGCLSLQAVAQTTSVFTENFDSYEAVVAAGWETTNQSEPLGQGSWTGGAGDAFDGSYNGTQYSFALVNYTSTTGSGTISNWLVTPVINLKNGDVISFYTRTGGDNSGDVFPDRMELRLSLQGENTELPSGGAADLGDFTTLAVTVNPNLTTEGYPFNWTQFTYTVSGLTGETPSRLAFRYFVENGGPTGDNSNIIGLDAVSVQRTLGAEEFFTQNFNIFPNPAANQLTINAKADLSVESIKVVDLNGRTVKAITANGTNSNTIGISELSAGVYFVEVASAQGKAISKFVKM